MGETEKDGSCTVKRDRFGEVKVGEKLAEVVAYLSPTAMMIFGSGLLPMHMSGFMARGAAALTPLTTKGTV